MKTGIYKITSPDGHVYIGQSINIEKRFDQHRLNNSRGYNKLKSSFNFYGAYNHQFEIIEECNFEILNDRESYWLNYYKSSGCYILNSVLPPKGKTKIMGGVKWKVIKGCSNYRIGSNGVVKRLKHKARGCKHKILDEIIMQNYINRNGVVYVSISDDNGKRKVFSVQKLIVDNFLEKGHTYYKIAPDWENKNNKQLFNNKVSQFMRKDKYDSMDKKPVIYKTIRL